MTKELFASVHNMATADACGPPGGITRRVLLHTMASGAMLPFVGLARTHAAGLARPRARRADRAGRASPGVQYSGFEPASQRKIRCAKW